MAYAKDIFDFLKNKTVKPNFNALPQITKRTEQCKVDMRMAWLKLKLFD